MGYEDDKRLVDELCAIEDGLSEWEVEFTESVSRWVIDDRRLLTDKQRATVERILERLGR